MSVALKATADAKQTQMVAECLKEAGKTALCKTYRKELERMRDDQRKAEESEYNLRATDAANQAAGGSGQPGMKVPFAMDFTSLMTPALKARALLRAQDLRDKMTQQVAKSRQQVESAKASVNVGAGTVPGLQSCRDGWHEWGLVCRKGPRCEGDPSKFLWQDGHQVCYAEEWEGRYNNPTCASDKDKIDGLCYSKCPGSHPHHIEGMPYLCAHSTHAHDAIKDQANYDFIDKDNTEAALACAEATLARDQGKIEEKCGFSAQAKWKAIGEKMATGIMSALSMGITDIVGAAGGPSANKWMFGHENRQGCRDKDGNKIEGKECGAADLHVDGVINAIISIKNLAREEACVKAIDEKDMVGFMNYCPLFKEADKPWKEAKDASGALIKNPDGSQAYIEEVPILPPLPNWGDDKNWDLNGEYPPWDVPNVPDFDESKLTKIPDELLQEIPPEFFPDPEKPDMMPPAYPIDLRYMEETGVKPPVFDKNKRDPWNILEKPNTLLVFGALSLAILSM